MCTSTMARVAKKKRPNCRNTGDSGNNKKVVVEEFCVVDDPPSLSVDHLNFPVDASIQTMTNDFSAVPYSTSLDDFSSTIEEPLVDPKKMDPNIHMN